MMKKRIQSFKFAIKGVCLVASSEVNFQIHMAATAIVLFLGFYFGITKAEWVAVLLCFALVLSAEAFNSAVEKLVDLVSPGFDKRAGAVKDVAAGAVLLCAIIAAVIGGLIFLPRLAALPG